ncbi:N-acetyl sugar amidotransferase [Pseudomonadales bacterium]|nr:N-acetyl sugar amidotransferase [Pseudomonadales bacterium]
MSKLSLENATVKICSRCIYDERVPSINFDSDGVCNYCHQLDNLVQLYGTGQEAGEKKFKGIVEKIKQAGKEKKYDCIVGVSGGTDSSYLLHLTKIWGLRPLAVHYDNTWNSAIATMNLHKVLNALDIDLYTHVISNKESDDLYRAFFRAGVAELDACSDLAYAYLLRQVASKYSIKFILEGHSFVEEGITPLGRNYFDGRYIQSIHRQFGSIKLETYPLMTLGRFLYAAIFSRVQFIRPLWYIQYSKENARKFLSEEFDWKYYGGHHLENRLAAFSHGVYLPEKFDADMRNNTLAACARNGALSREDAWEAYNAPRVIEQELVSYFKKRLEITDDEYNQVMDTEPKDWTEYPTYKRHFELLRPVFYVLAKFELVPRSFYLKYCFPVKERP